MYRIVLSPLAERQSAIETPLNLSPSEYAHFYFISWEGRYSPASSILKSHDWKFGRDCKKPHFIQSVLVHSFQHILCISLHALRQREQCCFSEWYKAFLIFIPWWKSNAFFWYYYKLNQFNFFYRGTGATIFDWIYISNAVGSLLNKYVIPIINFTY